MRDETRVPIGGLSEQTGVPITALRYYDEVGLISSIRSGGKRRFSQETVGRVNFIRLAKRAGFSLTEIGEILDDRSGTWTTTVDDKIVELSRRRTELTKMIRLLDEIRHCGCSAVAECTRSLPGPRLDYP